jgi:hypothetical protein
MGTSSPLVARAGCFTASTPDTNRRCTRAIGAQRVERERNVMRRLVDRALASKSRRAQRYVESRAPPNPSE